MIEPPPSVWEFPSMEVADEGGLVAAGADLAPGTLLHAYRLGCFPMPIDDGQLIGWWSPDPRAVLEPGNLVVSRSLRRSIRRFEIHVDRDFAAVVSRCADPRRESGWINDAIFDAYMALHQMGWAHSVETWADGEMVGGLYGVSVGALFAGESMFHLQPDASKVALVALVDLLASTTGLLLDVQWQTPHLASLGAHEISRLEYLERLQIAVAQPGPPWPRPQKC